MKYLRMSDLAKAVGVHPNTVRRYVDWGLLPPVEHSPSGYRRYGAQEISRLRVIRMLSRAGYSLSAILRMLIQLDRGDKIDLRRALDTLEAR